MPAFFSSSPSQVECRPQTLGPLDERVKRCAEPRVCTGSHSRLHFAYSTGRSFDMKNTRFGLGISIVPALLLALASLPAAAENVRIYVTNSAGDSVHVIDASTNKVVQVIKDVESAHGVAPSPDGTRVYIS